MKPFMDILNAVTGVINTGLSIVKDKAKDPKDPSMSFIQDKVKNGVSISSKRLLNISGTTAIIGFALTNMATNGITWPAVGLAFLGVVYSVCMAYITKKSEE